MRNEKQIEKNIISFLKSKGALVEGMQSGSIMIIKGPYKNKMNLQSKGCPDIICFYKGNFIGIEVKKNEEQYNKWIKLEKRFNKGEILPRSYLREKDQILYKKLIIKNGGTHILTYQTKEVMDYIKFLDNKN